MKKLKNKALAKTSSINVLKVKTGTIQEFFLNARNVMHAADNNEPITAQCATLTFVDPADMLHFLSGAKLRMIYTIRNKSISMSSIAKETHRNISAVRRDVKEMEKVGIVKIREEKNPAGHGRHKIVELSAPSLKLEAWVV